MARLLHITDLDLEAAGEGLGVEVKLRVRGSGAFELTWGDGVANEWTEEYALPEQAFARVAALLHACRSRRVFALDPAHFSRAATAFFDETTEA